LNALRAFEAAARHQSFATAADELHVTQGAVSRHVRLLEEHLGVALFRRQAQGVRLTAAGRSLLPDVSAAFERIEAAARRLVRGERELRVGAAPTLAGRWLLRRLARFHAAHPETRVILAWMSGYEDFRAGGFDLAIVPVDIDEHRPANLEARLLRQEALSPACAPARAPVLATPADLRGETLLHPSTYREDWRLWLRAAGLPVELAEGGLAFPTLEMAISAAIGGLGVAMVDLLLVRDELAQGVLVAPFERVVREGTGYLLVAERGRLEEPALAAFRDWLDAEVAADEADWGAARDGFSPSRPPSSVPS
jgi:LysR family glycine cleavage system transcriptional activator